MFLNWKSLFLIFLKDSFIPKIFYTKICNYLQMDTVFLCRSIYNDKTMLNNLDFVFIFKLDIYNRFN